MDENNKPIVFNDLKEFSNKAKKFANQFTQGAIRGVYLPFLLYSGLRNVGKLSRSFDETGHPINLDYNLTIQGIATGTSLFFLHSNLIESAYNKGHLLEISTLYLLTNSIDISANLVYNYINSVKKRTKERNRYNNGGLEKKISP